MMYFDPLYLIITLPALLLGMWAQWLVKSRITEMHQIPNQLGITGQETAQRILDANGIADVQIEEVAGFLSDHYSPGEKVLRLSPEIYSGRSVSSLAVAAHEVGHAIQHKNAYAPLALRSVIAPAAAFGSNAAMILIMAGSFLNVAGLFKIACVVFAISVFFTLVTLPVEFDASWRALKQIETLHLSGGDEWYKARKVLTAAAMTYVAAAVAAMLQLLYFVMLANRRRN